MNKIVKVLLSFLILFNFYQGFGIHPIRAMLITGGHKYDTLQFFQMFDEFKDIEYVHYTQPIANQVIQDGKAKKFDILIFYDMWKTITENEKKSYIELTNKGIPLLFLHHSIVSYQLWDEFEKIVGGKYVIKGEGVPTSELSTFKHDEIIDVKVSDSTHPIVKGINDFQIIDEVYGNLKISDKVRSFLTTDHPLNSKTIAWENSYNQSKIIYIQLGHDSKAYENPDFKKLVNQSIKYLTN